MFLLRGVALEIVCLVALSKYHSEHRYILKSELYYI
jgi:hypothetical protein